MAAYSFADNYSPIKGYSILTCEDYTVGAFKEQLPSYKGYAAIFENIAIPASFLIEESAGFSKSDNLKLSTYNTPWKWMQWSFNGINISDPFFEGAPAFTVPFELAQNLKLTYNENAKTRYFEGVEVEIAPKQDKTYGSINLSTAIPQVGGIWPPAFPLMDRFSGIHALQRNHPPRSNERRGLKNIFNFSALQNIKLKNGAGLYAGIEGSFGSRKFLKFNELTGAYAGNFFDDFVQISAAGMITAPSDNNSISNALFAFEFRSKENLYAEVNYDYAQTAAHDKAVFFGALKFRNNMKAALLFETFTIDPVSNDFSKEIRDSYGEAHRPYYPAGRYFAQKLVYEFNSLNKKLPGFYFNADSKFLQFTPSQEERNITLTYNLTNYGSINFKSESTGWFYGRLQGGYQDELKLRALNLSYNAYAVLDYALNSSFESPLAKIDLGLKGTAVFRPETRVRPFVSLAKTPVIFDSSIPKLLDPKYFNGEHYVDTNLINTTGGKYTSVSDDIHNPNIYSASLGVKTIFSDVWQFNHQWIFKLFHNSYWMSFAKPANEYGRYNSNEIFFYNNGEKGYELGNYPFEKKPLAATVHFQFLGAELERFICNISFSYGISIGGSAFGNGVMENDLSVIDYSQANPNTGIHYYGCYDVDRTIYGRILFSYQFFKNFWFSTTLKYRDGQPFAFTLYEEDGGQVAAYNKTRKANLSLENGGPREDCQWNIDLKADYTLDLDKIDFLFSFTAVNVFDLGNEIGENFYYMDRSSTELQLPRSFFFSVGAEY